MIPFIDLKIQIEKIRDEIDTAIKDVIDNTDFINGKHNRLFCENFAKFINVKHCIGVGNGTDGLEIALMTLGIGKNDEVIVPANSFIATAEAVTNVGAKVVFVDCAKDIFTIDVNKIEEKITPYTKCIIPVHLHGQPAKMDEIVKIAKKHNLFIIEDCAQAHGALYKGKNVGTFGDLSVFSFYPGKNLGAFGDAGAIVSDNDEYAKKALMLANHGRTDKYLHRFEGRNSRLDNLQAAILNIKLKHLATWNIQRRKCAELYYENLKNVKDIILPEVISDVFHVYHLFVIRTDKREKLADYLKSNGIMTGIHYPVGLPYLEAYRYLNHTTQDFPVTHKYQSEILSLPLYPELCENDIKFICDKIKLFQDEISS